MLESLNRMVERHSQGWVQIPREPSEVEEQCWDCRIVGSIALYSTSALSWRCFFTSRRNDLGNRVFFGAMGAAFLALGTYRAVTPTNHVEYAGNPRQIRQALQGGPSRSRAASALPEESVPPAASPLATESPANP
ncbi:unnamed protein product [Amoebophrya sp. A120]|nr:unnamed protein product [Amoebophrya sp. A120]|eukprot:GSA120T00021639001.1